MRMVLVLILMRTTRVMLPLMALTAITRLITSLVKEDKHQYEPDSGHDYMDHEP